MRLKRSDKENLVSQMAEQLDKAKTVVLVNYQGLKVGEVHNLKKKLFEQGIQFHVAKSKLFRIALKNKGIEVDEAVLKQPVGIVWGTQDEIIPAKLTVDFGKEAEKLAIIGGIFNGRFADERMIKQLAALPGREELYAKLVGTLNAPIYRLANVLQGNLRSLVYVLDQYAKSKA